jgi:hypothetical protein
VTAATYSTEPYVASPLSTQGRIEHVLYLHAVKLKSPADSRRQSLPAFLKPGPGASAPIPRPTGLAEASFEQDAVAHVARLLDGERTVLDLAEILIERGVLADDGTADAAIRGCLKVIFRQLEAPSEWDPGEELD